MLLAAVLRGTSLGSRKGQKGADHAARIVASKPHTHNPALEVVAIISLTLVLLLDAVNMQVAEIRRDWLIPFLALVPGTMLTVAGSALAAFCLLGVTPRQEAQTKSERFMSARAC